ncbi:MAG: LPS biosynthesis protein WbpP, partial [Proteobacteria bacterium]
MAAWYDQVKQELKRSPKRWLVTGVAGFIGCNILEELLKLGQEVVGIDDFSGGFQRNLDSVRDQVGSELYQRFKFHQGDINDNKLLSKVFPGVQIVLHQAARGSVPRSIEDPVRTNLDNVSGTVEVFHAAVKAGAKRVVYASSSSVYGDHPELPKIENKVGKPLSPYAASKTACELYAQAFSNSYGLELIGLRYFNVFGPRQNPEGPYAAVIPVWISHLLAGKECIIYGDGTTSRDFCYVSNVVQANILAGVCPNAEALGKDYNIAVGGELSLKELHQGLCKLTVGKITEPSFKDFRKGDVKHSRADISLARKLL